MTDTDLRRLEVADIELLGLYREATVGLDRGSLWERPVTDGDWDAYFSRQRDAYTARRTHSIKYSWSVPTPEAVHAIAEWAPIVDPMAGTGYWCHLLALTGADVIASDHLPPGCDMLAKVELITRYGHVWHAEHEPWHPVADRDAVDAVTEHADRTLLLSWPPYGDPIASTVEDAYWTAGGQRLVYIGEPGDGCTGDGLLHQRLGLASSECYADHDDPDSDISCRCHNAPARWTEARSIDLPQWDGLHDGVFMFTRNQEKPHGS